MDCADFLIIESQKLGMPITNLQLQKLLFVIAAEYRRAVGKYPFEKDERFEAWGYGPVMPEVYREYKAYGSSPIVSATHTIFNYQTNKFQQRVLNVNGIDDQFKNIVCQNLRDLLQINIFDIVAYTHQQKFWKDNNMKLNAKYPINMVKFQKTTDNLRNLVKKKFA